VSEEDLFARLLITKIVRFVAGVFHEGDFPGDE
jgi:hypothetical protein